MKTKRLLWITGLLSSIILLCILINQKSQTKLKSGAGLALDLWAFERAYPYNKIPESKYMEAFNFNKNITAQRAHRIPGEWESLGPKNIGGRTLCLAFHPTNEDIIYAGSASGGLWKTTTQGVGENAWEYVPTGFPVLGIGAIAIDPNNPSIMLIGTGETYGVGVAEPGTVNRLTRGTYGIGILKTTNGGGSWTQVLPFNENELKGVQDIAINNQNSQEMYAATTDGVYQSLDGGDHWNLIFSQTNCIDIEIDPNNGDIIYVTQGNFNFGLDPNKSGIFKSTNKGVSFNELIDPGLITAWSGNAKLSIDPSNSNTLYASIQVGWFNTGNTTPAGIYKSTDEGNTWTNINNQNIAKFQGWYSHDIAINPLNPSEIINVGIDAWKSTNSGLSFVKKSNWQAEQFGEILVNVPEGGPSYVHSDIHAIYYHPLNNKVFMATDGGVFMSNDGEQPFTTLNGGLQTTQFYPNMGSSSTNPDFCIAGAQDNASYIYKGNPSWFRVIGGDGMSASVNIDNDQIVFGSYQGLNIYKSSNGGTNFSNKSPNLVSGDFTAFAAPYEIALSNQNIMYAGGTYLYKSIDGAENWNVVSNSAVDVNPITKIAISPFNSDLVYVTTSPDPTNGPSGAKILKSTDGGQNFTVLTNGLPNRICKDLEFDPTDDSILYAVFSGFGTNHVFKTINGGANWTAIGQELPDLPTNTVLIDPLNSQDIYIGNDLGVYYSFNGGSSWEIFNDELPEATMVYDLNDSPANRMIRIATHGHGIYQRSYVNSPLSVSEESVAVSDIKLYPNPVINKFTIEANVPANYSDLNLRVFNFQGKVIKSITNKNINDQHFKISLDVSDISSGTYIYSLSNKKTILFKSKFIKK